MDLVPHLPLVILIAAVLLSVISYAVFKLRDKRRPKAQAEKPVFFRRYRVGGDDER